MKMRKKTEEMKKIIESGMKDLAEHGQKDLVSDILEIYFIEHVKKMNDVDDFLLKQCVFAFEQGDKTRTARILEKIIEYFV
jgi:hypothetical protein